MLVITGLICHPRQGRPQCVIGKENDTHGIYRGRDSNKPLSACTITVHVAEDIFAVLYRGVCADTCEGD